MKTSELLKILKQYGCYFVRHAANHDIWHSTINNREFPAPRHAGEVIKGTAEGILKQSGIK